MIMVIRNGVLLSEALPHCYVSLPTVVAVVVVVVVFVLSCSFNFNVLLCVAKNIGNVSISFIIGVKLSLL